MRKIILLCASLCAIALLFSASPVMAQQWVGPNGLDTNACTPTAPCATFQRAINIGASQINCLGSGNYGPVTIETSLTIDCGAGNVGNIATSATSAITISTTSAATIILRHLALNGFANNNTSIQGIDAASFSSGTLIVEDCMIHGYPLGFGIDFEPHSGRGLLQVSNTEIFNNFTGINVFPSSGQIASVTLNRVELVGNAGNGLDLGGAGIIAGTMRDSVAGENGEAGVLATAGQVFFTVEESSIVDNLANGIATGSDGSAIKVAASTIGGNGTGIRASNGSIVSFGDNHMSDNGSDGTFTSTKPLK